MTFSGCLILVIYSHSRALDLAIQQEYPPLRFLLICTKRQIFTLLRGSSHPENTHWAQFPSGVEGTSTAKDTHLCTLSLGVSASKTGAPSVTGQEQVSFKVSLKPR